MRFSDLPSEEHPRVRLEFLGAKSISNAELIALAIGAVDTETGYDILAELKNGISSLLFMPTEELIDIGFPPKAANRFTAVRELFARARSNADRMVSLSDPGAVAAIFCPRLEDESQERSIVLFLNVKNELKGYREFSVGTRDAAITEPRDIYHQAVKHSAAAIILVHNHPSGNSKASDADIAVTKGVVEAGKILRIPLLDHIVIGKGEYYSIRDGQPEIFADQCYTPKLAEKAAKYKTAGYFAERERAPESKPVGLAPRVGASYSHAGDETVKPKKYHDIER